MNLKKFTAMKEERARLLEKYYRGETTQEEERLLREACLAGEDASPEKEFFSWFAGESALPKGLESQVFEKADASARKRKTRVMLYSLTSVAATLALMVTLYVGNLARMEKEQEFRMIEQTLVHVSETLQPASAEPDMLVLWVDNDVEIIVN